MRKLSILALSTVLWFGCGSNGSTDAGTGKKPGKVSAAHGDASAGDGASADGPDGGSAGASGHAAAAAGGGGSGGHHTGSNAGSGGKSGAAGNHGNTGGSGGMVDDSSPALSELRDTFASAICDALETCVGASALLELTQREDCATRVGAQLRATDFAYLDAAVTDGRVLYDPSLLPACADDIRALACDVLSYRLPQSCADVLKGNVKIDGACAISAECAGTAFCSSGDQCPSHCTALLAAGDACTGDNQCGDDLLCVDGHCLRPSRAGEPCKGTSGKVCRIGFTCQGSTDVDTGMCVENATVQVGAKNDACEPGGALCKEGLSCVYDGAQAFHCEAAVGSGASCHLGLPGQCPNDEYCDTADVTQASVCRKLPGDGAACVLSGLCAPGFVCVAQDQAMTCRPISDNCAACSDDAECRSGHCAAGTCAPPSACGQASPCQ